MFVVDHFHFQTLAMKQFFTVLSLFLISISQSIAQDRSAGLKGSVTDEQGKPIESVTVSLLRAKDSALVKVAVSSRQGLFEFEKLMQGKYLLRLSAVGFQPFQSSIVELASATNTHELPAYTLKTASKSLSEVTVVARKPLIENKIDRTVVNVDAAPTNAGSTAMEVLEKSPGISVNNDGVVSLKGKQGVIVMMDGKPTYLSPADLANLLRNLPASAVDQIEIMPNPPAKFDASGNSGVINIKTKKSRSDGFNGSISTGGTIGWYKRNDSYLAPFKQTTSVNVNYRKGKVNLFGNFNYNYREGKNELSLVRNFYEKNGNLNSVSNSRNESNFMNNNYTLKIGLDYYIDKKNVIGIVANGFAFFGFPRTHGTQSILDANGDPLSVLKSTSDSRLRFFNYSTNLNYKHSFDSAGRELTMDFDYLGYNNTNSSLLITDVFNNGGTKVGGLTLRGDIPGVIDIYSFKSDYVHPLKNNMRFEAGVKASFVSNDNEIVYDRDNNGTWIRDDRSNHFIYKENINAAYASINKKWSKWSAQAGLRLENTIAKGNQVTTDSTFKRNYTSLFPTAFINYDLSKAHALTLSYGRRIDRPNYQDLNPFIWFLDSLTFRKGNPFILPQYSHNIELRHTLLGKFTTTINYTLTNDVISQIIKQNTDKRETFLTVDNVAQSRNMGIAINAPVNPAKWWNLNVFFNLYNNQFTGTYYNSFTGKNDPINLNYNSYMVNVTNIFTFQKGWTGEVSGFYRARGLDQLGISEPMYFLNLGAQKQVLKGKGTLRMNLRDPFHWQRFKGSTRYSDIDVRVASTWDNRSLTLTFSYRFGKNTVAQARKRNSSVEEQNRVGQSQ